MYNDFELMLSFMLLWITDTKRINPIILSRSFGRAVAQLGRASEPASRASWRRRCRHPPAVGVTQPAKRTETGVSQESCRADLGSAISK